MAKVKFDAKDGTLMALFSGEIDHHAAEKLRTEIDERLVSGTVDLLCLDFGAVSFMDSSGVGLILGRARRMRATGGRLMIQQPPGQICKMLDLAGISYCKKEDKP